MSSQVHSDKFLYVSSIYYQFKLVYFVTKSFMIEHSLKALQCHKQTSYRYHMLAFQFWYEYLEVILFCVSSMRRNVSNISLQDQEAPSSPLSTLNKAAFKPLAPTNRFVGITLPVDIRMIFEVCIAITVITCFMESTFNFTTIR